MIQVKTFQELTKEELYAILKARNAVFIVEQTCPYQDLDGLDSKCLHVFEIENGEISCYLRGYLKSDSPRTVHMGRVLTVKRGVGLGGELLKTGIRAMEAYFSPEQIYIEAQSYASGFYAREGFQIVGDEFLEDGIPHVPMMRKSR